MSELRQGEGGKLEGEWDIFEPQIYFPPGNRHRIAD